MKKPDVKPEAYPVDGNAFAILGAAINALRDAGADEEYVQEYIGKAKSGDYDHLLRVTLEYVSIELEEQHKRAKSARKGGE